MTRQRWGMAVLSTLVVVASFFYVSIAQAGAPPAFTKNFAPDPINVGGTSTLTFTFNNNTGTPRSNMAFTDNLPAGVVVASPTNQSQTCVGGMLSATSGSGTLSYAGGSVAANTLCTIQVDVTSSTVGTHVNTSSTLTYTPGGPSGPATDSLTVNAVAIPTLPQWGMILLTLSLMTMATWQLAGRPIAVGSGPRSMGMPPPGHQQWLTSLLLGQGIATLGLGVYALLVGPLVPHDGVGAFLSGLLISVMVECYRRSASR